MPTEDKEKASNQAMIKTGKPVANAKMIGKYNPDGSPNLIAGHNIPLATLGVFILWFGWFGFNPGSTMGAITDIAHIATTTNLAAAAGAVAAMFTAWWMFKKPDATMAINGVIAGLVAITAPCAFVSGGSAIWIGLIAGVLVVLSVVFFDRVMHIDDPVGAISAHAVCGTWGTFALGLFAQDRFCPGTTGNGLLFGGGWNCSVKAPVVCRGTFCTAMIHYPRIYHQRGTRPRLCSTHIYTYL